jgi:hypothetical protein|tara:strand:+ start:194 stop:682 length:489 start_codon:yes stop_codon:yes gene_type:complete
MGMDVYGRKPKNKTGEYFRANVWSYRPIYWLCFVASTQHKEKTGDFLIPIKTFKGMEYNDGKGLRSQRKCNLLSDYLQEITEPLFTEFPFEEECSNGLKFGVDKDGEFYIDIGFYTDKEGKFLSEEECKDPNIEKQSSYRTTKEHIQEFCDFLKDCGGFRVW